MQTILPSRLVFIVFFISGASALIFETVWFHITSLVLGSSVWSAASVLAAFMTGLASGTYLVSVIAAQYHRPQKIYLYLEILIGLTGVMAVYLLPYITSIMMSSFNATETPLTLLSGIRFLIAFIVLLIPATAMGATLPLLVKYLHSDNASFHKPISLLYGWNTIGAVFGVVLSEYLLIEFLGIRGSALFASVLNFTAALLIYRCSDLHDRIEQTAKPDIFSLFRHSSWQLLLPFMAGFILLGLEIIWFRYLLLIKTGTSEIFAIMLAVVLAGIGTGGLVTNLIKNRNINNNLLVYLPILAGILTILSFYSYQHFFIHYIADIYHRKEMFLLAAILLMLPVSIVSGILFPLMGNSLYQKNQSSIKATGAVTFFNTLGAAVGSLCATFLLLPNLGIEISILVLSCLYIVISFLALINVSEMLRFGNIIKLTTALIAMLMFFPYGALESNYNQIASRSFPNMQLVKVHEGLNETLQYYQDDFLQHPHSFTLVTNGHPMSGSNYRSIRYMKYFVYFPFVFNNDIENVLQISYGVGNTAEAVTNLPALKHFDVVDISQDIFTHSRLIHDITGKYPLDDPRTHPHVEDGRFFLQNARIRYDLITAEPPPPQNAGVVNLYTQEYFELIKQRLSSHGMVTYWLPVHSLGERPTLSIIRAFCNVFKDCSMWNGAGLEFMLVGSQSGLPALSEDDITRTWNSSLIDEFILTGFEIPELMAVSFMADADYLNSLTSTITPVSDYFPKRIIGNSDDEPELSNLYNHLLDINRRKTQFQQSTFIHSIFPPSLINKAAVAFKYESLLTAVFEPARPGLSKPGYRDLIELLENSKLTTLPMLLMGINSRQHNLIRHLPALDSEEYHLYKLLSLVGDHNFQQAADYMTKHADNMINHRLFDHFLKIGIIAKTLTGSMTVSELQLISESYPGKLDDWFLDFIKKHLNNLST